MSCPKPDSHEPTFWFRAQDRFMPEVLEFWAMKVEAAVFNTISAEADKSKAKAKEARALAHEVRAWQTRHFAKIPD
jgi:hypothetical protein